MTIKRLKASAIDKDTMCAIEDTQNVDLYIEDGELVAYYMIVSTDALGIESLAFKEVEIKIN